MWIRLGWWICLLLSARAWAGTFQVGLDRESVEVGGTAVLVYSFSDYGNVGAPEAPTIPGAEVQYLGASTQSSVSFINGRRSQQVTLQHRYGITPKAVGVLTIPEVRLQLGNETLVARAMQLTVTKGLQAGDIARLVLLTPTNSVYVGQPFLARMQFWFRQSPGQVGMPQLPTDGFVSGRPLKPFDAGRQQIGQEIWGVSEYPLSLSAARAGSLWVGPAVIEAIFAVGGRRGGFFDNFFAEQRRFTFQSPSNRIEVIAPPTDGQPAVYRGAIGRFTMRLAAQPTSVTVGDPITVKVQVQGRGSLESLALPEFPPDSGFRTYSGTDSLQLSNPQNFEGSKTFELVVVPERGDITNLNFPPLVSFDPETRRYVIAEAPPIRLNIHASTNAQAAPSVTPTYAIDVRTNAGPIDAAQLKPLGAGTDRPVHLATTWVNRPWYWITLTAPVLGLAVLSIVGFVLQRRSTDPTVARRAAAEARAQAAWSEVSRSQGPAFFSALETTLREQIGLVCEKPPTAIGPETIEDELLPRGFPEEEAHRLRQLFSAIDAGRFAPSQSVDDANHLREEADAVVSALKTLKLEGRP